VQIEFSALSFVAPENVLFRYQMEDWSRAGWTPGRVVRSSITIYRRGKYRFKVIACNNDGVWNEKGASLSIIVEPHIWETLWFKLLAAGAVFFFWRAVRPVVLILRRRHRFQIKQLEQKNALEHERTRIARDLHDDLGVGLTEIGLLGDLASSPVAVVETSREYLHESPGARGISWGCWMKLSGDHPANDTSQSLSDYFFRYAQTLLQRAAIRCRLEVMEPFPNCGLNAEERHQLFLAFKESLNNVIRHSGATESHQSGRDGWSLTIKNIDNGHGVEPSAAKGSQDGLIGMQKRLHLLGGHCEVTSAAGAGTCVTLSIPVRLEKKHDQNCHRSRTTPNFKRACAGLWSPSGIQMLCRLWHRCRALEDIPKIRRCCDDGSQSAGHVWSGCDARLKPTMPDLSIIVLTVYNDADNIFRRCAPGLLVCAAPPRFAPSARRKSRRCGMTGSPGAQRLEDIVCIIVNGQHDDA